jgi:GNAT superfamily N-acetyltransferase
LPVNIENVHIEPLGAHHLRGDFCCTNGPIQNFCRGHIEEANAAYTIRAFVACEGERNDVLGFYYLCLTAYDLDKAGREIGDRKAKVLDAMSAVYLGMIGVHTDHMKEGIGKALMRDAFQRVLTIAQNAGTYALTLDAVDEAAATYYSDKFGFQRFSDGGLEMFLPLGTIMDAAYAQDDED